MIYLILGIISNVLLFLAFRSFSIFKINSLQAIVVNYFFCTLFGLIYLGEPMIILSVDFGSAWSWVALSMGFMLVAGFYTTALTAQYLGISVASVASKMSMVFPIFFSLFFINIESYSFTVLNYIGMALAVLSIYLSSVRKDTSVKIRPDNKYLFLLPFLLFMLGGLIDTFLNYSNYALLTSKNEEIFPVFLFFSAALAGTIILLLQWKKFEKKSFVGGFYLSIPNFFAVYLVFKALTFFDNNGAVFFPISNLSIIVFSSIAAMVVFKEKLSTINFIGLGLSAIALFFISYQNIIEYFNK